MRRVTMHAMAIVVPALLAACATAGSRNATPQGGAAAISYETGPCFGACPVYTVTVRPDGSGTFEGRRFTVVTGTRTFTAGVEGYRRFAAALAPFRPRAPEKRYEMGVSECRNPPTDMPSYTVDWRAPDGAAQRLYFYAGCRIGNEALADALQRVPAELPIADFIGRP